MPFHIYHIVTIERHSIIFFGALFCKESGSSTRGLRGRLALNLKMQLSWNSRGLHSRLALNHEMQLSTQYLPLQTVVAPAHRETYTDLHFGALSDTTVAERPGLCVITQVCVIASRERQTNVWTGMWKQQKYRMASIFPRSVFTLLWKRRI